MIRTTLTRGDSTCTLPKGVCRSSEPQSINGAKNACPNVTNSYTEQSVLDSGMNLTVNSVPRLVLRDDTSHHDCKKRLGNLTLTYLVALRCAAQYRRQSQTNQGRVEIQRVCTHETTSCVMYLEPYLCGAECRYLR